MTAATLTISSRNYSSWSLRGWLICRMAGLDFRTEVLSGTDATTRVLIDTTDGRATWTTVGVAPNLVEASWQALVDGITYGLLKAGAANPSVAGAPSAV